jgi:hypothetical protein
MLRRPPFSVAFSRFSWPNERTDFWLEQGHYFGEHDRL